MRFKKGTKVEVLSQKEVPSGSWRCAEIISGNGHSCIVRYEGDMEIIGEGKVERVPWKAIRPCPPPVDVFQDWVPGDVVEVFHNFSWKMATVLKVLGRINLLVRLLGSAMEIKVNKYDVRARLCWQNGEWIVIGKASSKSEDLRFRIPSSRNDSSLSRPRKHDCARTKTTNILQEFRAFPSRTLKRKLSHCHYQAEAYAVPSQKIVDKRECVPNLFNVMPQLQLPEKVDDVASSRDMLHEKCMHPSLTDKIDCCTEMILGRERTNGDVGYSRAISLESNDTASVSSSVGSCSVYRNSSNNLHHVFPTGQFEDYDSQCSDAESFFPLRYEEGLSPLPEKEELTEEIHRLELHAYRCTISALYASGPLSWEQELLLTNLRDSLHISNDEHLMEIRNLVSSRTCIPSC